MSVNSTATAHSPSALPVRKVSAGGLAGALTAIIVWILSAAFKIDIPPAIASAITVVIGFIVAYLVPPGANDVVVTQVAADRTPTGALR